jgi:pimeloyl-ACP methyl ester carboxylesterase
MATFPPHRAHLVDVGAGVRVHVRDIGPEDAAAVIYFHGTPSSSVALPGGWKRVPSTLRLITLDRPGYARSDNQPGRTVADAASWTAAIADELGIGQFAVMGTSGGGPFAAASAASLTDRVTRLCVSVGLGPVELSGFDACRDMPEETVVEIQHARAGEQRLRSFIDGLMNQEDPLGDWMAKLPPSDQEILRRDDVRIEEQAELDDLDAGGIEGWLEDDLSMFARPWGVDLTAITAETLLLYGTADILVPHEHGDAYRAAIGHGQLVKVSGAGHWMRDAEPAVLSWLGNSAAARFELPEVVS